MGKKIRGSLRQIWLSGLLLIICSPIFSQYFSDTHVVTLSVPDYASMVVIQRPSPTEAQNIATGSAYFLAHNQKTDRKLVGQVLKVFNGSDQGIILIANVESPSGSNAKNHGPTKLLNCIGIVNSAADIIIEINRGSFSNNPSLISYDIITNDPETVFDGTIVVCYTLLPG